MELEIIDKNINEILDGRKNLPKFNQPEHAGVCSAGPLLVGAILVCDFTRKSITSGGNAGNGETAPANWEIDEAQEKAIQEWTEQNGVWIAEAENWLKDNFGPELPMEPRLRFFARWEIRMS